MRISISPLTKHRQEDLAFGFTGGSERGAPGPLSPGHSQKPCATDQSQPTQDVVVLFHVTGEHFPLRTEAAIVDAYRTRVANVVKARDDANLKVRISLHPLCHLRQQRGGVLGAPVAGEAAEDVMRSHRHQRLALPHQELRQITGILLLGNLIQLLHGGSLLSDRFPLGTILPDRARESRPQPLQLSTIFGTVSICQGSTEGRQRATLRRHSGYGASATGTRLQKGTRPNLRGRRSVLSLAREDLVGQDRKITRGRVVRGELGDSRRRPSWRNESSFVPCCGPR